MQESCSGPKKSHSEVRGRSRRRLCCMCFQERAQRRSPSDISLDGDNPEHIQWVFERAQERASEFSITGVTYRLTQGELRSGPAASVRDGVKLRHSPVSGVVKRIIPAVASTNAVIAGKSRLLSLDLKLLRTRGQTEDEIRVCLYSPALVSQLCLCLCSRLRHRGL